MPAAVIPKTQQDTFPLQTVQGAQQASSSQILGGAVTKYWGPGDLGISVLAPTTDANGFVFCVTPFLDTTGCTNMTALIQRFNAGALAISPNPGIHISYQYRPDKVTFMPTSYKIGASLQNPFAGIITVNTTAVIFPADANVGVTQFASVGWGPTGTAAVGYSTQTLAIGSDVRFFIDFASSAQAAGDRFSLSIWGSS